jgi:RNA polymerase sigma-70 factor (ECF subfamily)
MGVVIDELPPASDTGEDVEAPAQTQASAGDDDPALIRRLTAGDATGFDELVEAYAPRVARLAHRLLGWPGAAAQVEDVVQDVFVSVLRGARSFDGRSSLSTWITAITLNRCRSLRRRLAAGLRAMTGLLSRGRVIFHEPADHAPARADEARRVRVAVRKLKPADREVIVLHYFEHAEVGEVAGILGVSKNAVEVRLHRARRRLKKLLEMQSEPE